MNERDMTLGRDWTGQNPAGWLASEKLDGVRAYWDGAQLWTRGGRVIPAPRSFTNALPRVALDGELWAGRGRFTEARVACQYGRWTPSIRFMVFDAPTAPGNWAERMAVAAVALAGCPVAMPVAFQRLDGAEHAGDVLQAVLGNGGEGLILRNPTAGGYVAGRSANVLKIKADALVRLLVPALA